MLLLATLELLLQDGTQRTTLALLDVIVVEVVSSIQLLLKLLQAIIFLINTNVEPLYIPTEIVFCHPCTLYPIRTENFIKRRSCCYFWGKCNLKDEIFWVVHWDCPKCSQQCSNLEKSWIFLKVVVCFVLLPVAKTSGRETEAIFFFWVASCQFGRPFCS